MSIAKESERRHVRGVKNKSLVDRERGKETQKKKEPEEERERVMGLLSTFLRRSPFSSNSNNCHFVRRRESWRSLPRLSL